jgi:outer membrane protein TolC
MKTKSALLTLSFCLTFLIGGCSLFGSTYSTPTITTPKAWNNIESANITLNKQNSLIAFPWWKDFNDNTLNNLVEQALNNNNNIQIAIGNIISAEGLLQKVQMNWVPKVNIGFAASSGQAFNFSANSSNPLINASTPSSSNFSFYGGAILPSYSLNILQQIKQSEVAKANLNQAKYAKNVVKLAVITQVVNGYITLLALEEQLQEQNQIVNELKTLVNSLEIEDKYGYASSLEVNQIREELLQAKMQLPAIKNSLTEAQNALRLLINQNPGSLLHKNSLNRLVVRPL